MKLNNHFKTLLTDTINLNQDRLDQLDERVTSIYDELADDDVLGPYVQDKIPQGSWAQRTIIKPVGNLEFDADFLLLLAENPKWSEQPETYIKQVNAALARSGIYKDMPRKRKCRCVRVTYANSCHIDIVPFLHLADGRKVIVNHDEDDWDPTDPDGFTSWMQEKDKVASGNLRKVIRLLKYLRDHKGTFRGTRSVILTTLTGERVDSFNTVLDPGYYSSVPTALLHIVQDLDQWLQANPARPPVMDPSGSGVSFDHRWNDATYQTFRDQIHDYAADIAAAYNEPDKDTSVELWQGIFGDGFTAPAPKQASGRFGPVAPVPSRPGRAG